MATEQTVQQHAGGYQRLQQVQQEPRHRLVDRLQLSASNAGATGGESWRR